MWNPVEEQQADLPVIDDLGVELNFNDLTALEAKTTRRLIVYKEEQNGSQDGRCGIQLRDPLVDLHRLEQQQRRLAADTQIVGSQA